MNVLTRRALDVLLVALGADSTQLGNASLGLISAPFTPGPDLLITDLVEANFAGYTRAAIGTPSVPFTGADGLQYVQGLTHQWIPSDTTTPNTIYGAFLTTGNSTTALFGSDKLDTPVNLSGPLNALTITPRVGLSPTGNYGLNVISS